jgi:hypothetical protein
LHAAILKERQPIDRQLVDTRCAVWFNAGNNYRHLITKGAQMKRLVMLLAGLVFSSFAIAAQPTADSVEKLLMLMQTEKMAGSVFQNMDAIMKGSMDQAIPKPVTPEMQQAIDKFRVGTLQMIKEELSWEKMHPIYVQIYQESFTQDDIDGLINFYASPAGQSFIEKMPVVMQKSMTLMQARMGPIMQRMQAQIKEFATEAAATNKQGAKK